MALPGFSRPARFAFMTVWLMSAAVACRHPRAGVVATHPSASSGPAKSAAALCGENVGEPRVEAVTPRIWVALGEDLANTVLVHTSDGNVVIDTSMSPTRSRVVREALLARAPGHTRAIIYTHSHIDHVGGASEWLEPGTEIWATAAFTQHFVEQYGLFQPAQRARGWRQFGRHVSEEDLPCSALGRRPDLDAALTSGARIPTRTFSGSARFDVGDVRFELVEAHGETDDQLFVWIPSESTLLPGDNVYRAFPNLYTIRGTRPRPVDEWIASLDAMRRHAPEHLVPSHTSPVHGREQVASVLTTYRDGIQWVRDAVVRGANRGESMDQIASSISLPDHLRASPFLAETYGQIDWSARGIYSNALGWFDGRPETLYPLPPEDLARHEIALMGGTDAVLAAARTALEGDEPRWALHLLGKLRAAGAATGPFAAELNTALVRALRAASGDVSNTNGRAYLLESAWEGEHGPVKNEDPHPDDATLAAIPVALFFDVMTVRLDPTDTADVLESAQFSFKDTAERFVVTIRHGIAEVSAGDPLPGTPPPVATLTTDTLTWKRLATKLDSPLSALADGKLSVQGSWLDLLSFLRRFQAGT